MNFPKESIQALSNLLAVPHKAAIITHRNPDGDALGASLGWKFYLEKKGCKAAVISPTAFTENLKWIPGTDTIAVCENGKGWKPCEKLLREADVIYCLDFNSLARLENMGELVTKSRAKKVMIDHHQQPEAFSVITFSNVKYCATAEMVADIISDLGDEDLIDAAMAECLYVGLATDNGFFQFNNTTPNAHKVAALLIAKGARPDYVSEKINNIFRETRLRFFGYCLNEKLKLVNDGKVAYMMLSQAEIKKFNLQGGDSEGLVNYPFKIEGVIMSAYFSEEPDRIKISFRSRGEVDVNTFARTYFEGGGHRNAAGGKSLIGMDETEKKFLEALSSINFN
ncbi:MAG: bifunctional oligoribonuclease/PAP phosphatase NrnA [Chitinophagales bacterium]|nr:bifunctional oligoribonuclease/PAP phosphatase NrnA [Chitinophagales bacterium]